MQELNRQLSSIYAGDIMKMTPSAFSHPDCLVSVLPSVTDSHIMSHDMAFLQSHELFSYTTWTAGLSQSTLREECVCANAISTEENIISIAVLAVYNASETISFFKEYDAEQNAGTRFSVEVSDDDCGMVIDTERAASFGITVIGMEFPVDNGLKSENSTSRPDWRIRRESLNAGRMICLLKQQLNL